MLQQTAALMIRLLLLATTIPTALTSWWLLGITITTVSVRSIFPTAGHRRVPQSLLHARSQQLWDFPSGLGIFHLQRQGLGQTAAP